MPIIEHNRTADAILEQHLLDAIAFHDPTLPQQQADQLAATILSNADTAITLASSVRASFDLPAYAIEDGVFTITAATAAQRRALAEFHNLITVHVFHHIDPALIPIATQALKDTNLWEKTWLSTYQHAAKPGHEHAHLPQTPDQALQHAHQHIQLAANALYEAASTAWGNTDPSLPRQISGTYLDALSENTALAANARNPRTLEDHATALLTEIQSFRDSLSNGTWNTLLTPVLNPGERERLTEQLDAASYALRTTSQPFTYQRLYDHSQLPQIISTALDEAQTLVSHYSALTPAAASRSATTEMALRTALDARSYDSAANALSRAQAAARELFTELQPPPHEHSPILATALETHISDARATAERLAHFHRDQNLHNLISQYTMTDAPNQQDIAQQRAHVNQHGLEAAPSQHHGFFQTVTP